MQQTHVSALQDACAQYVASYELKQLPDPLPLLLDARRRWVPAEQYASWYTHELLLLPPLPVADESDTCRRKGTAHLVIMPDLDERASAAGRP